MFDMFGLYQADYVRRGDEIVVVVKVSPEEEYVLNRRVFEEGPLTENDPGAFIAAVKAAAAPEISSEEVAQDETQDVVPADDPPTKFFWPKLGS